MPLLSHPPCLSVHSPFTASNKPPCPHSRTFSLTATSLVCCLLTLEEMSLPAGHLTVAFHHSDFRHSLTAVCSWTVFIVCLPVTEHGPFPPPDSFGCLSSSIAAGRSKWEPEAAGCIITSREQKAMNSGRFELCSISLFKYSPIWSWVFPH